MCHKDVLKLYMKKIIPEKCILLKDDVILEADNEHIVTSWKAFHPGPDFSHGYSCYYLDQGFKISKFYKEDGTLLYWYCDIVNYDYNEDENKLVVTDLLADVVMYPDGHFKVVDLDELAEALEKKLITEELVAECLRSLHGLLNIIYRNKFDKLQSPLD